ncbi:MAG TPA: hypothetical protein VNA57_05895 [Acidimicrobiales bacterium]|nr:hypothetical protein [Acidimicrobiales bacterium]
MSSTTVSVPVVAEERRHTSEAVAASQEGEQRLGSAVAEVTDLVDVAAWPEEANRPG